MAATSWPWHIKVTRTDGTSKENDYSSDFDPAGYARYASEQPGVERVELSVTFVNGEAVSPQAATDEDNGPKPWHHEGKVRHSGMGVAQT